MTGKLIMDKNPMYKGGYVCGGYKKIGRRQYSHIIAEKMIGRSIRDDEVVHHINGNKLDNRPDNLKVMTRSEHVSFHQKDGGYRRGMKPWNYKGGNTND